MKPSGGGPARTRGPKRWVAGALALGSLALGAAACAGGTPSAGSHDPGHHVSATHPAATTTTTSAPITTAPRVTTSPPATTTPPPVATGQHGPITEPPLPAPAPGFVADQVTAIGDSVMIDYEGALAQDIPGVHVTAVVGRWWTTGTAILQKLKSEKALGAVVIVGLGTNGPVSTSQFDSMRSVLSGASRVVFVNDRVDRTWQDSNNAVLAQGVAHSPHAVLVNWYALAVQHPGWLYTTQTHLPIDGPGAQALAALVAAAA
jgi:hypothetical protein